MTGSRRTTAERPARLESAMNVTPLIDVLLVLLVIFMAARPQASSRLSQEGTFLSS